LFRFVGHRVLTVDTPIGRKLRPRLTSHAAPLVRVKPKDLAAAGVQRVPRIVGVRGGHPLLAEQGVLEVANVIWCTGFGPDFSWIDLPVFGENEHEPTHHRGVVADQPGLYFVGLHFLYAMSWIPSRCRQGRRAHRPGDPGESGSEVRPSGPDGRQRRPPADALPVSPRPDAPAWRWGNIPVPQAHLVGLGTGILLQVLT
jgi:hypothetical protein